MPEAEKIYRQILAKQPQHATCIHHLGLIALQSGNKRIAANLIRKSIEFDPKCAEAHNNLGNALVDLEQPNEAMESYRRATALKPDYAAAFSNLGAVLKDRGRLDEAIAVYRRAIALQPDLTEAHYNLADALLASGQIDAAIASYQRSIQLAPDYAEAFNNLGHALHRRGRLDDAVQAVAKALSIRPDFAEAFCGLGEILADQGKLQHAIAAQRRALEVRPDYPEAHSNLGIALALSGKLDDAITSYRTAISFRASFAETYNHLGIALTELGRSREANEAFRQAVRLKPDLLEAQSNLIFGMHYDPGFDARIAGEEVARWNAQHARPLMKLIAPHANDRDPSRRLRVGYVSSDLNIHPVGRFLLPLLANHNKHDVEVFAYAQVRRPDAITRRLQATVDCWRDITGLTDQQAAAMIRQDRIDILVDLGGHTSRSRLLIFAIRPAPVQISYLGYPAITGLETIDYRLTDAYADPPQPIEDAGPEKLFRLSATAWCYEPAAEAPPALVQRMSRSDQITFGSFNNFTKVNRALISCWAEILNRVPGSRLLLKSNFPQLRIGPAESARHDGRLRRRTRPADASRLGVDHRAFCVVSTDGHRAGHLSVPRNHHHLRSALDGSAGVTLAGDRHVSRVGASLLSNIGLQELIAFDSRQYIQIAVDLANDPNRIDRLRASLRQRMLASPLMDATAFARDIESAYRKMWVDWCDAPSPVS